MDDLKAIRKSLRRIEIHNTPPRIGTILVIIILLLALIGWFMEKIVKEPLLTAIIVGPALLFLFRKPIKKWMKRSDTTYKEFDKGSVPGEAENHPPRREDPGPRFE